MRLQEDGSSKSRLGVVFLLDDEALGRGADSHWDTCSYSFELQKRRGLAGVECTQLRLLFLLCARDPWEEPGDSASNDVKRAHTGLAPWGHSAHSSPGHLVMCWYYVPVVWIFLAGCFLQITYKDETANALWWRNLIKKLFWQPCNSSPEFYLFIYLFALLSSLVIWGSIGLLWLALKAWNTLTKFIYKHKRTHVICKYEKRIALNLLFTESLQKCQMGSRAVA